MIAMPEFHAPAKPLLIVEDDPTLRRVLSIAMRHVGFSVEQAGSGAEALAWLEADEVSGVLLDLGLPDDRSIDVLTWLHAHEDRPPWLVLSAMDRSDATRIDDTIGSRFISKPFDPWQLIDRVKEMTAQQEGGE